MPAPSPPRLILVPVDFSDASKRALGHAKMIATATGARLALVYVVDTQPVPTYGLLGAAPEFVVDVPRETAAGKEHLASLVAGLPPDGPAVESGVRIGSPVQEILHAATEQRADLVVMGTHGRRGISRLLLGSVAEAVARRSTVPVVLVH